MTLAGWALAAILRLAPFMVAEEARAVDLAEAIGLAASSVDDAALLVSIAWLESGKSFENDRVGDGGHSVSVWQLWVCPGARCEAARTDLAFAAQEALAQARASLRACRHLAVENRLAQYTTGACITNKEARQRWHLSRWLLREVPLADDV